MLVSISFILAWGRKFGKAEVDKRIKFFCYSSGTNCHCSIFLQRGWVICSVNGSICWSKYKATCLDSGGHVPANKWNRGLACDAVSLQGCCFLTLTSLQTNTHRKGTSHPCWSPCWMDHPAKVLNPCLGLCSNKDSLFTDCRSFSSLIPICAWYIVLPWPLKGNHDGCSCVQVGPG